jgi:hypothetical protein
MDVGFKRLSGQSRLLTHQKAHRRGGSLADRRAVRDFGFQQQLARENRRTAIATMIVGAVATLAGAGLGASLSTARGETAVKRQ